MALLDCAGPVKGPVLANPGNSLTYLKFGDGMANVVIFGFGGITGRRNLTGTIVVIITQRMGDHKPQFREVGLV
jgi:hypothetical protein